MTTDRDLNRVVRSWLDEGVTALPDRVLDAVFDQLPTNPQRRPSWLARRLLTMNNPVRFGLLAAAGLLLAVIGLTLINRPNVGPSPSPSIQVPVANIWTPTGSMSDSRYRHTATLLLDGRVLAVGGSTLANGAPPLDSAELYDPQGGTWRSTGSMNTPRASHAATLLADGRVLVVGGSTRVGGASLDTAESYDPQSGTWLSTGSMNSPRVGHTATLLPDGRVLVVGGSTLLGSAPPLDSAELYDPQSGTWSSTGSMNDPRLAHTATLLPDGTVLVAGSYGEDSDGGVSDTAEIYDPATGRWTPTASMHADRSYFTATLLLDGTVLVVGGWGSSAKTSELYDPASRTWTMSASAMSVFRSDHAATLLADGRVLVVGDYKEIATYAEIYDPETGMWTATGNMNVLRNYSTVTLLSNGVVLVSGGGESGSNPDVSRSAELYNPQPGA